MGYQVTYPILLETKPKRSRQFLRRQDGLRSPNVVLETLHVSKSQISVQARSIYGSNP